jgi:uncharacterized protein (DUF427 family)
MGLMSGAGPFAPTPAGRFNFEPPPAGQALYLDPSPKRVRAVLNNETIADSRAAFLLHESGNQPVYYFPAQDVRSDLLEPTDHRTTCATKGEASYYTARVGSRLEENVAWSYPTPVDDAPPALAGLIAFYFNRIDTWLEEDEEIVGHPRDPYHRIDLLRTSDQLRFMKRGEVLAETTRAIALFETSLPTRWYLPREDVTAGLEPSDTHTICPYKGTASYFNVRLADGTLVKDLVWYYADPREDVGRIGGLVCFYNERIEISLNGVALERPDSPWSKGRAADPALTRG